MAVRGDDPLKIMQPAGHRTCSTTQGYIREAENLRAGFGVPFPPLPTSVVGAVPEPNVSAVYSASDAVYTRTDEPAPG